MITRLIFVFLLIFYSIFLFSQEIIKNADGSVSVLSKSMIYFDSSGIHLNEIQFQDSLKTGNYDVTFLMKPGELENRLKKRRSTENYPELQLGDSFPQLDFVDINQKKIKLGEETELKLLTFWDITCKPCIEELIVFNILANEYPEVDFITLTSTSKQNVNIFFQEKDIEWKNLIIIPDCQEYFEKFKILNLPFSIIINKNRIIKKVFIGKNIREILLSFEDLKVKEILYDKLEFQRTTQY